MSKNEWIAVMYAVAIGGAFIGLLYPSIVAAFIASKPPPRYLDPTWSRVRQWATYLALGLFLSAVLVTLGFAGFLGDADNQKMLKDAGFVAYTLAFGFGFGSAALIEEPLKR
jgi:hypothetical protein